MPAGKITELRAQAKDPQRVNVFINSEFAIGVSLNTIAKVGLYVGKQLNDEEYAQLEHTEYGSKAFQAALRLLEARPRSSAELRERLGRKDFTPETIEATLARLTELDLIDDAAFARSWVANRQLSQPRSVSALRGELRRKGIDADLVADLLNDDALTGDETESAWTLARAAVHKYANSADRNAFTRRLGGYLQRRGFSFEIIRPIIDQLWQEIDHSAEDEPAEEDQGDKEE